MLSHKRSAESLQPQDRHQASNRYKNHQLESAAAAERRFAAAERQSNATSSYHKLINNSADQLESDDTQELEDNWRETAQIFDDDDQFLFEDQRNNKVSKQQQQQQNQTRKLRSQRQGLNKKSPPYVQQKQRRVPVYLENVARSTPESGQSRDTNSADNEADDDDHDHDDADDDDDDNSSISFAQSGCHSILSAWRVKAANRAARRLARNNQQQSASNRPTSVLSNGSSAITKKSLLSTAFSSRGKSPASQTRIALGPAQAQHFVTNSRRRRQANELILETLEARRRAFALSRQNTASLFGSASYLDTIGIADGGATTGGLFNPNNDNNATNSAPLVADPSTGLIQASSDDYNTRLSLSPSPIGRRGVNLSPSGAQLHHRGAPMSDLGTSRNNKSSSSPTSTSAREQRLIAGVNYATKRSKEALKKSKSPPAVVTTRRPPLAKLDQNSSDLYTSNSSSSDSSESSGSQFTQLVTSELTPDCILLDEQVLSRQSAAKQQRLFIPDDKQHIPYRHQQPRESFKRISSSLKDSIEQQANSRMLNQAKPPKVPERTKRKQNQHKSDSSELEASTNLKLKTESELEKDGPPRLRRNTLRRDSIRRLRLSQQQQQDQSVIDSSSDVVSSSKPNMRITEQSSPFLNRGHFRTNSARTINGSEHQQQNSSADLLTPKRNSWLFGSSRSSSNKNDIEAPTEVKPRIFSAARRSNSSDHLTTNKANKPQQQQQQRQQKEELRQVERMLRQMKPNQVFTSYTRDENNEMSSIQSRSQNTPNSLTRMRTKSSELPSTNATNSPYTTTRPRSIATSGRYSHDDDGNEATSPTKMVKENTKKSLNNSMFDSNDNGRQYEVEERIKYEKSSFTLRDSSLGKEESRSQNMISLTETKRSTSNISPPFEFADPKQLKSTASRLHQKQQPSRYKLDDRQTNFHTSRELVRNISDQNTSRSKSPVNQQQQQQQQQVAPKTSYVRRASSEGRPAIVARRSVSSMSQPTKSQNEQLNNKLSATHTTNKLKQQQQQVDMIKEQPSLPKFERTADDEFKKRVDYLRKLAHANLSDEPLISRATGKQKVAEKALTKPMSTNWRQSTGSSQEERKENDVEVVGKKLLDSLHQSTTSSGNNNKWSHNLRPSADDHRSKEREHARNVAMTNIDTLLAADRYQLPLSESSPYSEFKWRRSNSSLASLPSSRPKLIGEQPPSQTGLLMSHNKPQRQLNQSQQEQHLGAQSALSSPQQQQQQQQQLLHSILLKPRELTSSAVVKLVVKEKSAPKLDYAHVEQQPSGRQQAVDNQQSQQTRVSQHVLGTKQAPQMGTTWATTRPMLRVASPKSPDFGATATSSNDDSAIASSVSSPSLSFVMNQQPGANEQMKQPVSQAAANRSSVGRSTSPASSKPSIAPRVRSGNLPVVQKVEESSIGNVGALQGILRRQQQQQQQQQQISAQDTSSESCSLRPQQQQQVADISELIGRARVQDEPSSLRSDHTRIRSNLEESTSTSNNTSTKETSLTEEGEQEDLQREGRDEQVGGSGTRRVHFNDKTSIRSFESVSSLASNSTAVPNDNLRQQVGSPDSMGSGSTSRLSAESPDLRKTSGAAIYAIRGDPELELEQANNLMAIHQQVIKQQQQQRQPIQYVPAYQATGHSAMVQAQSCVPYLKMTAPPSISTTGTPPQQCSPRQVSTSQPSSSSHSHVQYIVRPTSLTSTQIVPTRAVINTPPSISMLSNPMPMVVKQSVVSAADDDDDLYALRLRQAATSRVFNYASGAPSSSPVIAQQQQLPSPVHLSPAQQSAATILSGQKKQPPQSSQQQQRHLKDLRNYQTEV